MFGDWDDTKGKASTSASGIEGIQRQDGLVDETFSERTTVCGSKKAAGRLAKHPIAARVHGHRKRMTAINEARTNVARRKMFRVSWRCCGREDMTI
jgi:hypothetical protein